MAKASEKGRARQSWTVKGIRTDYNKQKIWSLVAIGYKKSPNLYVVSGEKNLFLYILC